jgi:hypothetical protein
MHGEASAATATTGAQAEPTEHSAIGDDRLVGAEAIGRFIDPRMSARMARRLLEAGLHPCWREAMLQTGTPTTPSIRLEPSGSSGARWLSRSVISRRLQHHLLQRHLNSAVFRATIRVGPVLTWATFAPSTCCIWTTSFRCRRLRAALQ